MTKYTSPTKKARIVHDKTAGLTDIELAKKYHLHRSTINRINCRYAKSEDYYNLKQKTGRRPKFTVVDARQAVRMLANTNAHDVADLQKKYFPDIHPDTIRKILAACGLKAYIRRKKPLLTKAHKQKRLAWAKAHADWTVDDWKSVIFSNESKFNLIGSDGRSWCWRMPGQALDE